MQKRPVDVLARHAYANRFSAALLLVGKCRAGHVPEVSIARQHEAAVEKPVLRPMHKIVHRNRSGGKLAQGIGKQCFCGVVHNREANVAVPKADARSGWPGPCTATSRMRCPSRSCPVLMSGAAAARGGRP